ncbi:MAG: SUMF1/EgtB/PvdO family nonheme iron enzyme [Tannerellaceae bacterium]|nr:SUMF1/EgtB/PvdO family nonheme iron enzyme [Tannerellaceae bacterium]
MSRKIFFLLALTGLVLLGFQACSTEDTYLPQDAKPNEISAVKFSSHSPATRTTNGGDEWVLGDSVGIYMTHNGTGLAANKAANRLYTVSTVAVTTDNLQPGNAAQTIYWEGTQPMDFVAYYPFKPTGPGGVSSTFIYPIDIQQQFDTTHIDVLYAYTNKTAAFPSGLDISTAAGHVPLDFQHVLTKLVINVSIETGTNDINIAGMEAIIGNTPITTTLDLKDGTLGSTPHFGNLGMLGYAPQMRTDKAQKADTTYKAIIIPHVPGANAFVQFKTSRRVFTWDISSLGAVLDPSTNDFKPGLIYTFNLTLFGEADVHFTVDIDEWKPGEDIGDQIVNPDKVGVVSKKFIQGGLDTLDVSFIPAASFLMGSNDATLNTNSILGIGPEHQQTFTRSFQMTQTEITNAQYLKFVKYLNDSLIATTGTGLTGTTAIDIYKWVPEAPSPTSQILLSNNANGLTVSGSGANIVWTTSHPDYAITNVSWYGALAYARWAGGDLPTEAEWEYSARGGLDPLEQYLDETPTGTGMGAYATTSIGSVRTKNPNGYNLYDVFGNAEEWVYDRVVGNGKTEVYPPSTPDDYKGTASGFATSSFAVLRGASGGSTNNLFYISRRFASKLDSKTDKIGFRVIFPLN